LVLETTFESLAEANTVDLHLSVVHETEPRQGIDEPGDGRTDVCGFRLREPSYEGQLRGSARTKNDGGPLVRRDLLYVFCDDVR
jgi:hypothetical protein